MSARIAEDDPWVRQSLAPALSDAEKKFRDAFVTEYLLDYEPIRAAMRMGFVAEYAGDYAKRLMSEPYVQQEIKRRELALQGSTADAVDGRKRMILMSLTAEATYRGPGSSHSARVSALKILADIEGLNAPIKTESKVEVSGGVQFYLPSNGRDPEPAAGGTA